MHAAAAAPTFVLWLLLVVPVARVRRASRRARGLRPAILRGPVPITSIAYAARADRLRGYSSETVVYRTYKISDRDFFDHDLTRYTRVPVVGQLVPYAVFLWAGLRFDVFSFFFDGGLLGETPVWRAELPLLRLAGKEIVVYPYGGDARLPSRTRAIPGWHAYSEVPAGSEDRDERDVREHLDAFGRHAGAILGCADLVEDLPRVDGIFHFPIDLSGWEPVSEPPAPPIRIVHASNHRHYKGTRYVIEAVETLRREGEPVELVLVEGVRGAEARRVYEGAHVIVDQLLIGAYALFAIEAMALGKPVICFLNPRFGRFHPEWAESPIVSANPDTVVAELRRLVRDGELRRSLGARGPDYVRRHHSLDAVGADLDAVYRRLWSRDRPSAAVAW